jgi:acetyl-CoA/propionyl-CoA carboxylase biotin carboxyl carrier protein
VIESEELKQRAQELDRSSRLRTGMSTGAEGAGAGGPDGRDRLLALEIDGRRHEVRIHVPAPPWAELAQRHKQRSRGVSGGATGAVTSPMQGTVLSVAVAVGDVVGAGDLLCVVEAMKMENEIVAHTDGMVAELRVAEGDQVSNGQVLCVIAVP